MGYTSIAGMPVITGLYTILVPLLAFALLGSSRHLVVGADSATAALLAAGLAGLATAQSSEYVALAGMVALMAAALLLIARLIGLGFLADFMSRTVLIGFMTGVGIQVACGQVGGMLGLPTGTGYTVNGVTIDNTIAKLASTLDRPSPMRAVSAISSSLVLSGSESFHRQARGHARAAMRVHVPAHAASRRGRRRHPPGHRQGDGLDEGASAQTGQR